MKKFKISLFALAAIIIAATSAFTTKADLTKTDTIHYYQFSENTSTNLMDDSKWVEVSGPAEGCGSEVDLNCTIQLETAPRNSAGNPDFSASGITSPTALNAATVNWKASQ